MSKLRISALPGHKPLGASGYEALDACRRANMSPSLSKSEQAKADKKASEYFEIEPIRRAYEDLIRKASYISPDPRVHDTVYFMVNKDWIHILLSPSKADKKKKWDDLKFFIELGLKKGARMEFCACRTKLLVLHAITIGPDGGRVNTWKTYCSRCLRQKNVKVPPRVRRRYAS